MNLLKFQILASFYGSLVWGATVATPDPAPEPECHIALAGMASEPGRNGAPVIVSPRNYVLSGFLNYTPLQMAKAVMELYPEIQWLTKKVEISPEDAKAVPHPLSPSVALFGELHPEVDRTVTSLVALQEILAGDYDGFTKGQPAPVRLKKESFEKLRNTFLQILRKTGPAAGPLGEIDAEKLDALVAFMAIHDLGKSKSFANVVEKVTLKIDPDHDRILIYGLAEEPMLSLSYSRLAAEYRHLIMSGMQADFNMGQFAQAENVPGSMKGLQNLDPKSFNFYFIHLLLDVAGASGVKDPTGSGTMIQPVYDGFAAGYEYLPALMRGEKPEAVYDRFLADRAKALDLPFSNAYDRAIVRLCLLSRATSPDKAQNVIKVFSKLPENVRALLEKELNVHGTDDGFATLIYYAPGIIVNAIKGYKAQGNPNPEEAAMHTSFLALARIYAQARATELKGKPGSGVYTANVKPLADVAIESPDRLLTNDFEFSNVGTGADVSLVPHPEIDLKKFEKLESLKEVQGENFVFVGIGGGSDGVQAGLLADLFKKEGKNILGVVSVRSAKPEPQSAGKQADARTISGKHGGEIAPDVTKILPETTGSGRFLENLPPRLGLPTYLLVEQKTPAEAEQQLKQTLDKLRAGLPPGAKITVVSVDTGGDSLYPAQSGAKKAKATPDQDLRVLRALHSATSQPGTKLISAVIAPGIDSPPDAAAALQKAQAKFYILSDPQKQTVLNHYHAFGMDGSNPTLYGKTALAWQAALTGARGMVPIPLPVSIVTDWKNPWIPFARILEATPAVFFMDGDKHLQILER